MMATSDPEVDPTKTGHAVWSLKDFVGRQETLSCSAAALSVLVPQRSRYCFESVGGREGKRIGRIFLSVRPQPESIQKTNSEFWVDEEMTLGAFKFPPPCFSLL